MGIRVLWCYIGPGSYRIFFPSVAYPAITTRACSVRAETVEEGSVASPREQEEESAVAAKAKENEFSEGKRRCGRRDGREQTSALRKKWSGRGKASKRRRWWVSRA
jgi:hypothetical protein